MDYIIQGLLGGSAVIYLWKRIQNMKINDLHEIKEEMREIHRKIDGHLKWHLDH